MIIACDRSFKILTFQFLLNVLFSFSGVCVICDLCVHVCVFCGLYVHANVVCGLCVHVCVFCGLCVCLGEQCLDYSLVSDMLNMFTIEKCTSTKENKSQTFVVN